MKKILLLSIILFSLIIINPVESSGKKQFNPLGRPAFPTINTPYYLVWQDFSGWHIRWSSTAGKHLFSGKIISIKGQISNAKALFPYLQKKEYKSKKRRIVFSVVDNKKINGLNFRTNAGLLKIDLLIDGKACYDCIFIGMKSVHPRKIPFSLIPVKPGIQ